VGDDADVSQLVEHGPASKNNNSGWLEIPSPSACPVLHRADYDIMKNVAGLFFSLPEEAPLERAAHALSGTLDKVRTILFLERLGVASQYQPYYGSENRNPVYRNVAKFTSPLALFHNPRKRGTRPSSKKGGLRFPCLNHLKLENSRPPVLAKDGLFNFGPAISFYLSDARGWRTVLWGTYLSSSFFS
jgi:hypothetical protein